jgi:membrane protein required for colicin V production
MTIFDYIVLIILGLSILVGVMRGLLREVLSIAGWVAAFLVAKFYTAQLSPLLPQAISSDSFRYIAAFIILFLATLIITSLLAMAISQVFKATGLGLIDRIFGAVFGFARGVMIVGVFVMLSGLTEFPKKSSWSDAMFSAPLEAMVLSARPWMPPVVAEHIKFE